MNVWRMISVGSLLFGWFSKASADGKITAAEVGELLTQAMHLLGLNIALPPEIVPPEQNPIQGLPPGLGDQ